MTVTNNSLVTPKIFAKLTLFNLRSKNSICRNMSTEVTPDFTNKVMKVGDTVTVRRPYRFQVTQGLVWTPQPLQDTVMPIKVDRPLGIHFQWDTLEKTLSLRDANALYAEPAAIAMSATINQQAGQFCAQNTNNYVGTPGTLPTTVDTFLGAGSRLVELGCPENEELHLIVNRRINDAYIAARASFFNPQQEISSGILKGRMVDNTLGYTIDRDQSLWNQQVGTFAGTPAIGVTSLLQADGGDNATMTIVMTGFTGASGSNSLNQGDKFQINNVYSIHPQTKVSTNRLKGFTVLQNVVDAAGTVTATVFPAITPFPTDGSISQYANTNAAAVAGALVFIWAGTTAAPTASSGQVSVQGLVMHKNAFAFVSVPLANPQPNGSVEVVSEAKDPETGMWMSFIRAFDTKDRIWVNRFDSLVGYGKLYAAELSCVLAG
jgi:hypothetical protein